MIKETQSSEIERKAYEAEQNRKRLALYYRKSREIKGNIIRLPLKHFYISPPGRVIGS